MLLIVNYGRTISDGRELSKEGTMLVLTRGVRQKIEIGDRIVTVTVLQVKGGRVRLGVEAPEDVTIRRMEAVGKGSPAVADSWVG